MPEPIIIRGYDTAETASIELLNVILHVAARPGCTLADLTKYVSDLRDQIMTPVPRTQKFQLSGL